MIGRLRPLLTKRKLRQAVRETLARAITYFQNHRPWMKYDEYLTAGMPVGSDVVESA